MLDKNLKSLSVPLTDNGISSLLSYKETIKEYAAKQEEKIVF